MYTDPRVFKYCHSLKSIKFLFKIIMPSAIIMFETVILLRIMLFFSLRIKYHKRKDAFEK